MKKILIVFIFSIVSLSIFSQSNANCFRIYLADKNNSPYSINNPSAYLSERAIHKRERFHIALTTEDLPVNSSYILQIKNVSDSIQILSQSKWANTITIYCPDTNYLATIRLFPFVTSVLPVANYALSFGEPFRDAAMPENQPSSMLQVLDSTIAFDYGYAFSQIAIHNGQYLHSNGFQGDSMLIAVLDAGFNNFDSISYFQPLYANGQIWGTRDLIPGVNNVYEGHYHGTSVTSIMATDYEGIIVGTAPRANYYLIRPENPWSEELIEEDFWAQAAEIADSIGADVINSSLGYTEFFDFPEAVRSYAQSDGISSIASLAATKAGEKGIIVCASAGNEAANVWHYIGRPADAINILAVGAVDADSLYAPFSSVGPSYDGRVKPDITSLGWNTFVVYMQDYLDYGSGTSFSSPVIAGLAACLWQALPQKSASDIMQIIRESGHLYNNPDIYMGYGIPDFYQAYLDNPDTIPVIDTNSINQPVLKDDKIVVFPNPCQGIFKIINTDFGIEILELYDVSGRMVKQIYPSNELIYTVNIEELISGIYFGKAKTKNGYRHFKIIKKS